MANNEEYWLKKELDLSHKHEQLLITRETLLKGREAYYDIQEFKASSFISSYGMSKERNNKLLSDLQEAKDTLKERSQQPPHIKFQTLQNNYWSMIRNVLPVWQDEVKEYSARKKRSPRNLKMNNELSFAN